MKKQHFIFNLSQIQEVAKIFIKDVLQKAIKNKRALVIGLEGNLGTGKTTFIQALARELKIKEKILSPTFIIMRKFRIRVNSCPNSRRFAYFYHLDCYRIDKPKEVLNLGFKEIISEPQNIVVIEWADKIKRILPKNTIWLKFSFVNERIREIEIKNEK